MSPQACRRLGQGAALAGRLVFANPFIDIQAIHWREGWHSVAEQERGTQPQPSAVVVVLARKGSPAWGE